MQSSEIIEAMKRHMPVMYDGSEYKKITEYILWFDKQGNKRTSVSLLDKNGATMLRAPADRIELARKESENNDS